MATGLYTVELANYISDVIGSRPPATDSTTTFQNKATINEILIWCRKPFYGNSVWANTPLSTGYEPKIILYIFRIFDVFVFVE